MSDPESEFVVTFKNGALERLKKAASDLGVSEDNLGDVLIKGLKLIEAAKEGTLTIEKGKERYVIDIKRL